MLTPISIKKMATRHNHTTHISKLGMCYLFNYPTEKLNVVTLSQWGHKSYTHMDDAKN